MFAPKPEAPLGMPTAMPLKGEGPLRPQHYWETHRWHITRTRYVDEWRSMHYEWYPLHGSAPRLHNTLDVALNSHGSVDSLVLSYQMDGLSYSVHYDMDADTVRWIRFTSRTNGVRGEHPYAESPVPLGYVLRRVPTGMTPSFGRAELTSV